MSRLSMRLFVVPLLSSAILGACQPEPVATRGRAGAQEAKATAPKVGPRIAAKETVYDFGAVDGKGKIVHVFTIQNTGDEDLLIEGVKKT